MAIAAAAAAAAKSLTRERCFIVDVEVDVSIVVTTAGHEAAEDAADEEAVGVIKVEIIPLALTGYYQHTLIRLDLQEHICARRHYTRTSRESKHMIYRNNSIIISVCNEFRWGNNSSPLQIIRVPTTSGISAVVEGRE